MRIKLKRHKRSHEATRDAFLKSGAILTDEEKYGYFEELLEKLAHIENKVKEKKERLRDLEAQVDAVNAPKVKEEVKPELLARLSLPPGWRMAGSQLCDPEGNTFRTIHSALHHMITVSSSAEDDLETMTRNLVVAGWESSPGLAPGWRVRREGGKASYLAPDCCAYTARQPALARMAAEGASSLQLRAALGDSWLPDPALPDGWFTAPRNNGSGAYYSYMNIQGKHFESLSQVLRHLHEERCPEEAMERARRQLLGKGWLEAELLPPRWLFKKVDGALRLLSAEYINFRKTDQAIEHLQHSGLPPDEIVKFQSNFEILNAKPYKRKRDQRTTKKNIYQSLDWKEDESLPSGCQKNQKRILSPDVK
jgi:hypothetical protein